MTQRSRTPAAELQEPQEPTADLERAADALLDQVARLGLASGLYTQTQLDRKIRTERKRTQRVAEAGISEEMIDVLVERRMEELIDVASLTVVQEIIYRLHVAGFGRRRMARVLGIRRETAERRLRTVKRRIRAAYEEGRYAGWYEVYLSEVNRPAYRRRK